MRLTDPWFEAEFIGNIGPDGSFRRQGANIDGAQGIFLYSPCAFGEEGGVHAVVVPFANPRNAPPVPANFEPATRWAVTGTGLDDLSLYPSIDCTVERPEHMEANRRAGLGPGECSPGRRCWHGFITNGEVMR